MIRKLTNADFQSILNVVNNAAIAYKGKIPNDMWKEPYMPAQELKEEIQSGVQFYGCIEDNTLIAVMGIQPVNDVTLIRHAYVLTSHQRKGFGEKLLKHLLRLSQNIQGLRGNMGSSSMGNKILSETRVQTGFNPRKE